MDAFVSKLLGLRTHRGLTQVEAADLLGMSRRSYIELEKGRREPNAVEVAGITSLLGQNGTTSKGTVKAGVAVSTS